MAYDDDWVGFYCCNPNMAKAAGRRRAEIAPRDDRAGSTRIVRRHLTRPNDRPRVTSIVQEARSSSRTSASSSECSAVTGISGT